MTLKNKFKSELESLHSGLVEVNDWMYDNPETGFEEFETSKHLVNYIKQYDNNVLYPTSELDTAFEITFGKEGPLIVLCVEYDALPEIGHACGHNIIATCSIGAGLGLRNIVEELGIRVKLLGTPAEEGGSGKVYMVREGLFNDVDIALHWHPGSQNAASAGAALANKSAKFRFHGISAHAAGSPEKGRSALDGVEAMNLMINMMREHIPQEARIHYVITAGGKAPNVVPDFAEVYYYARHNRRDVVIDIFERMVKAAEGAALGTGTTMDYEMIGGTHELLPNLTLQKVMHDNLSEVGGIEYTAEEKEFADKIAVTLGQEKADLATAKNVQPYKTEARAYGSTDVGDVSFTVPTVGFGTATWVPGTPAHSWQAVAAGGTSIGRKGMMVAAKTLTKTAIDLFKDKKLVETAKAEFLEKRGADFKYIPLLGDRAPALDYRK